MHMKWSDPATRPYKPGQFYVGASDSGQEVGVTPSRHAVTVAGARAGKGACVIIPNLLRWPESALVIDPKGEAAEATAEYREQTFGQPVHVLDPFNECNVPERLKARFNPLDALSPDDPRGRADLMVLADGLIMRHDAKAAHWDGGGLATLAGLIAFVAATAPPEQRNLPYIRRLFDLPLKAEEGRDWDDLIRMLRATPEFDRLPIEAATKLSATGNEALHFRSVAEENTRWLSDRNITAVLSDSTFDLSDLKTRDCTVYLVLPSDFLKTYGSFLRLFVMSALNAMMKGGTKNKRKCLFLLDEFHSLGFIDLIASAAGLMPGYGVHLWPFMQDVGQLFDLYGPNKSETFLGNADLAQFFGLGLDERTPAMASKLIGPVGLHEVDAPPPTENTDLSFLNALGATRSPFAKTIVESLEHEHKDEFNLYHHQMRLVGSPRVSPDEARQLTKLDDGIVADNQICFIKNDPFLLKLVPYF